MIASRTAQDNLRENDLIVITGAGGFIGGSLAKYSAIWDSTGSGRSIKNHCLTSTRESPELNICAWPTGLSESRTTASYHFVRTSHLRFARYTDGRLVFTQLPTSPFCGSLSREWAAK
jgi:hypothetical protein